MFSIFTAPRLLLGGTLVATLAVLVGCDAGSGDVADLVLRNGGGEVMYRGGMN